jgi:phosphoribosylamine--glycine ligase
MKILLIGSGGREHAMAWKISQSPLCTALFIAPGNPGTAGLGTNVPISVTDFDALGNLCVSENIDLVVVGPEVPLVSGIRDFFQSHEDLKNILMVGPGSSGARLEGSKDFSKQFMQRHQIPTAAARTFKTGEMESAENYLASCSLPIVLKADGLAAGKGVIITDSRTEAVQVMREMLEEGRFGAAGSRVLVESFLTGIEVSVFILTDGKNYVLLPEAKDYKRIGENDQGPNTGGMGAVSPVAFADNLFLEKVKTRIIEPTIHGLNSEHIDYKGFIFFGLISVNNEPFVIEYNARMGDPETQVVMSRLNSDFVELLVATARGELKNHSAVIDGRVAVTVSMVSAGYPGDYKKGLEISGLKDAHSVFHAGTKIKGGKLVTDGGRVLSATGMGANIEQARNAAYSVASSISWDGVYFRNDIGLDLLKFYKN